MVATSLQAAASANGVILDEGRAAFTSAARVATRCCTMWLCVGFVSSAASSAAAASAPFSSNNFTMSR